MYRQGDVSIPSGPARVVSEVDNHYRKTEQLFDFQNHLDFLPKEGTIKTSFYAEQKTPICYL